MNKRDYKSTNDYKKSIEIFKNFVRDVLDGDIEKLRDFDFTDLTTYVGDIIDPDMYLITQTSLDKGTQRKTTENELPSLTQCTA